MYADQTADQRHIIRAKKYRSLLIWQNADTLPRRYRSATDLCNNIPPVFSSVLFPCLSEAYSLLQVFLILHS